jgi:hypothetical protein
MSQSLLPSPIWPLLKETLIEQKADQVIPVRDEHGEIRALVYPLRGDKSPMDSPEWIAEMEQQLGSTTSVIDADQAIEELLKKV